MEIILPHNKWSVLVSVICMLEKKVYSPLLLGTRVFLYQLGQHVSITFMDLPFCLFELSVYDWSMSKSPIIIVDLWIFHVIVSFKHFKANYYVATSFDFPGS